MKRDFSGKSGAGLWMWAFIIFSLGLAGCGQDSGAPTTVLSGMASKGPIKAGTVKVYAVRDGVEDRSAPIAQGVTDDSGNYAIDCGSYKGAVVVEVTGGSYKDEVNPATVVTLKAPLRAVIGDASTGKKTVAVTPLTELAYKKAKGSGNMSSEVIAAANAEIAASFNLTDIVATLPVAGGSSDDQKKYAAACGSFAQLVNDSKGEGESLDDALERVMTQMGNEVQQTGGLTSDTVTRMNDAITTFNNSGKNQAGAPGAPLPAPKGGTLKIATAGAANTIAAIDVTVDLPAGVTVKADAATGEAANEGVTISGVAVVGGSKLLSARFTPAAAGAPPRLHIGLLNTAGFGLGEFVTVKFDLNAGAAFPADIGAFTVTGLIAKGVDNTLLSGITAAPASLSVKF